jgi:TatD DNase family protein
MIDVHAHLCFEPFDKDREIIVRECKKRMKAVIVSSARYDEGLCVLELLKRQKKNATASEEGKLFATLGYHPTEGGGNPEKTMELIRQNRDNIVGVGEVGLDYHWEKDPGKREGQKGQFSDFIKLADELGKPLVIHSWDAEPECFEMVKGFRHGVVFHCYSGSKDLAREILEKGFFISFSTQVLFSKNHRKLAKFVPLKQMLLETDAPFLSPFKHMNRNGSRQKEGGFDPQRNYPWNVELTAGKIAELRKIDVQEVIRATDRNAEQLFKLDSK